MPVAFVVAPHASAAAPRQAQASDYVIGPQDVLLVTEWDQPDLTGKFTVESDGSFTFPLIGRVKAGGLSLRELETELTRRLAPDYLTNPQVSIAVEQYRSQRIFVVGEVKNPGPVALTGDTEHRVAPGLEPMHLQPVFKDCRLVGGSVSTRLFERGLCLPSGSGMTVEDRQRVVESILSVPRRAMGRGSVTISRG